MLPLKKAAGVLFPSTCESLVWVFRRLVSYTMLGKEGTATNIDNISYTLCPIPSTKSYKSLEIALGEQRRIDHIKPDGNCLFRSLLKELLGHEKFHHIVQQVIVEFIKGNKHKFRAYITEESVESHCKQLENLGEWGTQAEIFAAATLLKVQISIYTR